MTIAGDLAAAEKAEQALGRIRDGLEAGEHDIQNDYMTPPEGRTPRIQEARRRAESMFQDVRGRGEAALVSAFDKIERLRRNRYIPDSKRAEAERYLDRVGLAPALARAKELGDVAMVKAIGEVGRYYSVKGTKGERKFLDPLTLGQTIDDTLVEMDAGDEPASQSRRFHDLFERWEQSTRLTTQVLTGSRRGAIATRMSLGYAGRET
jgi:hypothetical protein